MEAARKAEAAADDEGRGKTGSGAVSSSSDRRCVKVVSAGGAVGNCESACQGGKFTPLPPTVDSEPNGVMWVQRWWSELAGIIRYCDAADALGARSAWSTASGGGCVAGRARVDHGCVRARVVGKRKPHLRQPGAMADASNVRHDTIVVPERMTPAQVRALAERKAQAQVGDDDMVAFLHLHGSRPVGGEHGTEVEWRYSYQVIPPGDPAADTAG